LRKTRTFTGWEGETEKTWRIENGEIVAGKPDAKQPRNEFLCTTRDYADFELRLEYRRGDNNGGIQFRSERVPKHHEVSGYQADFAPGIDGCLYDESRRNRFLAVFGVPEVDLASDAGRPGALIKQAQALRAENEKKLKIDEWNRYRIRAEGPRIRLWINDVLTVDYTEKDPKIPLTGKIALQIHSGATEIRYRNIVIEELSAKAVNVKISRQYDAERRDFTLERQDLGDNGWAGRPDKAWYCGTMQAFVILPVKPAADGTKPWLLFAPTIEDKPNKTHEWMFKQLLANGFTIAGINVGESSGNPEGRAAFTKLYEHLVQEYGVARKVCLLPQSRGGLMVYNWAAENPDKVQCIGGLYPVCDIASYPGILGASKAYRMTEDQLREKLAEHNPIDRLAPLAKVKVPILHVHGDKDGVVPLKKNSEVLHKRYQALGGPSKLIVIPGKGHEVCPEIFNCQPLVDFFLHYGQEKKQ